MRFSNVVAGVAKLRVRPIWAAVWAVALSPLLIVLAVSVMSVVEPGKAAAAVAAMADPLSVLGNRSPGERGKGAMTQTKPGYDQAKYALGDFNNVIPGERVLPNVRYREPTPLVVPPTFATVPVPADVAPGAAPAPANYAPSSPIFTSAAGGGSGTVGGPGGGTGGGGTGSGPGGGGGDGGGEGPPPPVPEPMTWMMMIAGLFSIGAMLRSSAHRSTRSAGATGRA